MGTGVGTGGPCGGGLGLDWGWLAARGARPLLWYGTRWCPLSFESPVVLQLTSFLGFHPHHETCAM